jgi:hypothetical protein
LKIRTLRTVWTVVNAMLMWPLPAYGEINGILQALNGGWVLDEKLSDPPPRLTTIETSFVRLALDADRITVTPETAGRTSSHIYSLSAGQRRLDGDTETRLTWTTAGATFESGKRVNIAGVPDTLHESHMWRLEASGLLTIVSEMETPMGRHTHRAVYRRLNDSRLKSGRLAPD